jgi:hypothetical protein
MKKIVFSVIVVLMMFMFVSSSEADVANRLYLVPVERVGSPPQYDGTGPKYFDWALDPDPPGITADRLKVQTYGFHPWILVLARGIDVADHTFLSSQSDVYVYPEVTPGPGQGGIGQSAEQPKTLWFSKQDRNGADTQPFLDALTDIDQIVIASESDGDSLIGDFLLYRQDTALDGYYEVWIDIPTWSGGLADGENVLVNGTLEMTFDDSGTLTPNLDASIPPPGQDNLRDFYETINIPTDWLGPANTYRDFLRQQMGMFQFHNRYQGISGGKSLFENADLSTRYNELTAQQQVWFDLTVASFGIDPSVINPNAQLRQLLKQAGDFFANSEFKFGGIPI